MTGLTLQREDSFQLRTYKKFPFSVERGEDVWVYTDDGDRYLDLYGGHAVVVTGHCHPRVVEAIRSQAERLIFYSNLVYNSERAQAAERLIEVAPTGLTQVFFVNSGAEANENAMKLARRLTDRKGIISFEGGFHGRTYGALSATGIDKYRRNTSPLVPHHVTAPFGDLSAVSALMNRDIAGVILEPIQSMAGVRTAPCDFYQGLRRICDEHGALLIYDEVQTGIGRTGQWFFAPRHGVTPDMITLAKGLASGVPMGAVVVTSAIAGRISYGDLGTTFGGGPLACAAMRATLDVIGQEDLLSNVRTEGDYLRRECRSLKAVTEVLGLGFLIGMRLAGEASVVQRGLLERKILTGLSEDPHVLRLLPPLTLRRPEIDWFLDSLSNTLEETA